MLLLDVLWYIGIILLHIMSFSFGNSSNATNMTPPPLETPFRNVGSNSTTNVTPTPLFRFGKADTNANKKSTGSFRFGESASNATPNATRTASFRFGETNTTSCPLDQIPNKTFPASPFPIGTPISVNQNNDIPQPAICNGLKIPMVVSIKNQMDILITKIYRNEYIISDCKDRIKNGNIELQQEYNNNMSNTNFSKFYKDTLYNNINYNNTIAETEKKLKEQRDEYNALYLQMQEYESQKVNKRTMIDLTDSTPTKKSKTD